MVFNRKLQICDTPESVECNARPSVLKANRETNPCLNQTQGVSFPSEIDCNQYILCLGNDLSYIANCPVGSWYDPKNGNCGPNVSPTACLESQTTSTTSTTTLSPNELCVDEEIGVSYPYPPDCQKYVVCLGNDQGAIVNCIYNTWFDPLTSNCGPNVSPTACTEDINTATSPTSTTEQTSTLSPSTVQSTTTTTTTTELPLPEDICGGLKNGEYVSYPDNCSKYVVCVEPIPYAFYCTPGYYFSENLQQCVDWELSDCPATQTPEYTTPGSTTPSICENSNGGTLPYPDNCAWFIQCINDNVYMMGVCNSAEYYDPATGNCSASASPDACREYNSTTTLTTPTTVPPTTTTETQTTVSPTTISQAPTTDTPTTITESTTPTTTITTTLSTTTSTTIPTTTSTTTTTTSAPIDPCADVPVGKLVPYPYDCTKFVRCDYPNPVILDCVVGQEFSAQLERCMAPWIANCTAIEP
ncbi:mucin-2 [Drosophila nasuta]|uniref:mucin-2 n=1 Tax=Drosophila nasuta TaxID=42062 RepID=UPI00295F0016|nr:mucin-2 [Drosophila nasuta]